MFLRLDDTLWLNADQILKVDLYTGIDGSQMALIYTAVPEGDAQGMDPGILSLEDAETRALVRWLEANCVDLRTPPDAG